MLTVCTCIFYTACNEYGRYIHISTVFTSEKGPQVIFVKHAFLVLFDSLFHTTDDDVIIQIIGATIYVPQVFV